MSLLCDDIKKKLKVALITKLEELDVCVEKELPEYILSIIFNNKGRDYMEKCLNVFMGSNSRIITDWLYSLHEQISSPQEPPAEENVDTEAKMRDQEKNSKPRKRKSDPGESNSSIIERKRVEHDDEMSSRTRESRYKNRRRSPDHHKSNRNKRSEWHRSRAHCDMEVNSPVITAPRLASSVFVKGENNNWKDSRSRANMFHRAMNDAMKPDDHKSRRTTAKVEKLDLFNSGGNDRLVTVHLDKKPGKSNPEGFCAKFANKIVLIERGGNEDEIMIEGVDDGAEHSDSAVSRYSWNNSSSNRPTIFDVTKITSEELQAVNGVADCSRIKTRCKYWPECNSAHCTFIHPKQVCLTFPHCNFGTECIFIHPPCRYAKLCYNENCTYTHASIEVLDKLADTLEEEKKKNNEQSKELPITMCHFKGKCVSSTCKYRHPPKCRFGDGCKNPKCIFYHGPLSDVAEHYSWRAPA